MWIIKSTKKSFFLVISTWEGRTSWIILFVIESDANPLFSSAPDNVSFWLAIEDYWLKTLEEMNALSSSSSGNGTSRVSQTPEVDETVLAYASECLANFENYSSLLPENESCPMIFDSWSCWKPTKKGQMQTQACPNFPQLGFSPSSESLSSE